MLAYVGVLGHLIVDNCLYVKASWPLTQGTGRPKQPMAIGPNVRIAAAVCIFPGES